MVCQHMHSPKACHVAAVKRILGYLKGTLDHGLHFTCGPLVLSAYADADWARDTPDGRSTNGSSWAIISSLGVLRNNQLLLGLPLRLNTGLWLSVQLISPGFTDFFLSCIFLVLLPTCFGVIICMPLP